MDFKERISKIIEYSKLSTSDFADAVDVPRSSISHIASGRNKPSLDFLVKVKTKFPELEWDWLISGVGEMQKNSDIEDGNDVAKSTTAPPDLFSIINDDHFGKDEETLSGLSDNGRDFPKTEPLSEKTKLSNSQPLDTEDNQKSNQNIDNQPIKIKRIVMFFENGKFESFEP